MKPEKCDFHTTKVSFMGFTVSKCKIQMDPKKTAAVRYWPTPSSVKEVQRFLGFANFYQQFIHNFSSVAMPLTALTKKSNTRFFWTSEAGKAFLEFKQCFTSAPVLVLLDPAL